MSSAPISDISGVSSKGNGEPSPAQAELARRIAELGDWFHNIDLHGVPTAPEHFLGDFPNVKWKHIGRSLPEDLKGASVLDIGCNGGFYSIAMKRRGAGRVVALDVDDRYLAQARFAAETLGMDIEFQKLSVYDIDQVPGKFDYVFFMGVFYHLRYPVYALDKVVTKVGKRLIFQSMLRGSEASYETQENYHFWNKKIFSDPDFPCMYFIEKSYADDPTNWFIPNRAGVEGILRSAGLKIVEHPEDDTYVCEPDAPRGDGRTIFEAELLGVL
jgi:tRNA (mo5U34)-methyltransferase